MYVVTRLPGEGYELQRSIQIEILAQAEIWAYPLAGDPLPDIYSLPLRFVPEPANSRAEEWVDPYTVVQRGFGDCDDLVIFRLAQIYASLQTDFSSRANLPAWPQVHWMRGTGRYHVAIRLADGREEDPAKYFLEKYG